MDSCGRWQLLWLLQLPRRQTPGVPNCTVYSYSIVLYIVYSYFRGKRETGCVLNGTHTAYTVEYKVQTVQCTPCKVYSVHQCPKLYTSSPYSLHCRIYSAHCTLYIKQLTLYNIQCTLYTVYDTVYMLICTVHTISSVKCTVYSLFCG